MHFFKAMIFIILLKTILHKGTAQNLRCIEGEQNIHSALWDEYVNHILTLNELSRPGTSMSTILSRTERVITRIMQNIIEDENENENPDQLCLNAIRYCVIYEGPAEYVTVTAEGLQKIEDMGGDVILTPELYPRDMLDNFRAILKSFSALKCKVQINYVPRNNVPTNDVPLEDIFANMTFNDDVFPNEVTANHVTTTNGVIANSVTANGFVENGFVENGFVDNSFVDNGVAINGATATYGFHYYGVFFNDHSTSDTDSTVSGISYDGSSYAVSSDSVYHDAGSSNAGHFDAGLSDPGTNDTSYFFIFLFRRERLPMFIFCSRGENNYSPAFQIQTENEDEEPTDINNTNNSNEHI